MKNLECMYRHIWKRTFDTLVKFNPGLSKDENMITRFKRASNLEAVKQTQIEWKEQWLNQENN